MTEAACDPIGEENYKISLDPDSRRCGFGGCQRWIKKEGWCAPCTLIETLNAIEIAKWNDDVIRDREARDHAAGRVRETDEAAREVEEGEGKEAT